MGSSSAFCAEPNPSHSGAPPIGGEPGIHNPAAEYGFRVRSLKLAPRNDLSAISPKSRPNFSAKFRSLGGSSGRAFLHMLTATRDDGPHAHGAHAAHYGTHTPPRSLASRFAGGIQIVGSLVGIPLALIGGYSTYHSTFSPEGRCQALRGNIVSMLDKKADASTLRL